MKSVDARGLSCPQPVIETKRAIHGGLQELVVLVDNVAALENVTRFSRASGYQVKCKEEDGFWSLMLTK